MGVESIILAGGMGERANLGYNKLLHEVNGKPLIAYTLEKFQNAPSIDQILLVVNPSDLPTFMNITKEYGFSKVTKIKTGETTRTKSVYEGIKYLDDQTLKGGYVVVHDGARPNVSVELIEKVVASGKEHGAAAAAVSLTDTIKCGGRYLGGCLDRDGLFSVQTPQCFESLVLEQAYSYAYVNNIEATDDSTLVERIGRRAYIVSGEDSNIKITTKADIAHFEALIK